MSSLQFLNKKSWHVNTRKNEERVWLREQAAQKEAARVAELQKQLTEERKLEEIRRLQRESGNGEVSRPAPQIDWMYEGPGVAESLASAAEREACLVGKKEAELPSQREEEKDVRVLAAGSLLTSTARASLRPAPTNAPNPIALREAEAKLREDPLLSIRRQQLQSLERLSGRHKHGDTVKAAARLRPITVNRVDSEAERSAARKARKEERARIRMERHTRRSWHRGKEVEDGKRERTVPVLGKRGHEGCSELEFDESDGHIVKNRIGPSSVNSGFVEYSGAKSDELRADERAYDLRGHRNENRWSARAQNKPDVFVRSADLTPRSEGKTRREGESREDDGSQTFAGSDTMPGACERLEQNVKHFSTDRSQSTARRCNTIQARGVPLSSDDRERRFAEMQANAEVIENRRAVRVKLDEEAEISRRENDRFVRSRVGSGPKFLHDFARDALDNGQLGRGSSQLRQISNDFD